MLSPHALSDAVVADLLRLVEQLAALEGRPSAELAELASNSAQPLACGTTTG